MINKSTADWIHLDVMDGTFVPNISFGLPIVQAVATCTQKPLDVHLMIVQPEKYLDAFAQAGAKIITIHYEACTHLHRTIQQIHHLKCQAGVAINPHTPVNMLVDILPFADLVCVMAVNPGFGGQKFIPQIHSKVKQLHTLRKTLNKSLLIAVDGGVNIANSPDLLLSGADILIVGHAIFHTSHIVETIQHFKNLKKSI